MTSPSGGNWAEYQRLVLAELERHNRAIETLAEKLSDLKSEIATRNELAALKTEFHEFKAQMSTDLATLKAKASGWGALAGAIAALFPVILMLLFQHILRGPR